MKLLIFSEAKHHYSHSLGGTRFTIRWIIENSPSRYLISNFRVFSFECGIIAFNRIYSLIIASVLRGPFCIAVNSSNVIKINKQQKKTSKMKNEKTPKNQNMLTLLLSELVWSVDKEQKNSKKVRRFENNAICDVIRKNFTHLRIVRRIWKF